MFVIKVCMALEAADVSYALAGGHAVALHGAVRGTVDVDLTLSWTLQQLQSAEKVLKQLGLISQLPVNAQMIFQFRDEYIHERNLVAWNFYNPLNPLEQVDIIITHDLKKSDVVTMKTSAGPINVLKKSELIAMKKLAGRLQDLEDIKALEKLK